jgi:hypothetical protein
MMAMISFVSNVDLAKIKENNIKPLSAERQVKAIRMWIDQNLKNYGMRLPLNTDEQMQSFLLEMGKYLKLYVDSPMFLAEVKKQKGYGVGIKKVLEGTLGKITEDVWNALPEDLQKRLDSVLSANAPAQGGQGIKSLSGSPQYKGVKYDYELKFLGAYGNHRCYGNQDGSKILFSVYDPTGSLH